MNPPAPNRLSKLAINPEGFVFDPLTGNSYTVNATGLAILEALRSGKKSEEIARILKEAFEEVPDDAWKDSADFLTQLRAAGLLEAES
jgi:PqqD family protein of HPr-rel-A system